MVNVDKQIFETNSKFGYILFEIDENNLNDSPNLKTVLKNHLPEFNVLYPTHDNKFYVYSLTEKLRKLEAYLMKSNQIIKIDDLQFKRVKIDDNGFSEFGLFKPKQGIINEVDMNDYALVNKFFNQHFGIEVLSFKLDKNELVLLKTDSYQRMLLDYIALKNMEKRTLNKSLTQKERINLQLEDKENDSYVNLDSSKSKKTGNKSSEKSLFISNYRNKSNLTIEIRCNNLLDEQVNAIVNASNFDLEMGGGVAGAIRNKCGKRVQQECYEYLNKREMKMNISEVMHTKSYNLHKESMYIIHAVGPRWNDYKKDNKQCCFNDLKNCFFNILIYCEKILPEVKSIAIPLISSGIFAVPRDMCCKALFEAIDEYIDESDDSKRNLQLIKLINLDMETNLDVVNYFQTNLNVKNIQKTDVMTSKSNETNNTQSICVLCNANKCSEMINTCGCTYCYDCFNNVDQNAGKCVNDKCKKKRC